MFDSVKIFGTGKWANDNEKAQFERLLRVLREQNHGLGEWACFMTNIPYHHRPVADIENDTPWRGEIDCVLFARRFIVIYELKHKRIEVLYGRSDKRPWKVRYLDTGKTRTEPSYFIQLSKQRVYLLRNVLNEFKAQHDHLREMQFVVDARLVFLSGTKLDGFYHKVPQSYKCDEYYPEIHDAVDEVDRSFLDSVYIREDPTAPTVKLRNGLSDDDFGRIKDILDKLGEKPKTAKWFDLITSDGVASDLATCGSEDNNLVPGDAYQIAEFLRLHELPAL